MAEEVNVHNGKTIAVISAKGGVGRTLISVNLAVALNKKNLNVCLVDADSQFGDVSLAMDLQPTFTMKEIVEELGSMDAGSISNYLTSHSSGIKVVPSPEKPEYAELVNTDSLLKVVDLLRNQMDYLVVDTEVGIGDQTVDILEHAHHILIVTNLEMTALKSTKLMLETLEKLGLREKVSLVVNRFDMDSLIKAEDVPEMMGCKEAIYLPNDFKISSQSMNLGIPLVISHAHSTLSKAFFKTAENMISDDVVSSGGKQTKSSFFRTGLFKKKK